MISLGILQRLHQHRQSAVTTAVVDTLLSLSLSLNYAYPKLDERGASESGRVSLSSSFLAAALSIDSLSLKKEEEEKKTLTTKVESIQ